MSLSRAASIDWLAGFLRPWLIDAAVTEIAINRPGEVWAEAADGWASAPCPDATLERLESLVTAVAQYSATDVTETQPILSATLPSGERVQIVRAPACEVGTLSITIRKPAAGLLRIDDYEGAFWSSPGAPGHAALEARRADPRSLLVEAARGGANMVIAGDTGSGKSTLMKALVAEADAALRIITIEDVPELDLPSHPNNVRLFCRDGVTPTDLLKASLRMKPDRILLTEVRGGEAFDFLNVAAAGHSGSITSVHAGSCDLALERLALMVMQSEEGRALPYEAITRLVRLTVDVVVHMTHDARGRRLTGIELVQ